MAGWLPGLALHRLPGREYAGLGVTRVLRDCGPVPNVGKGRWGLGRSGVSGSAPGS